MFYNTSGPGFTTRDEALGMNAYIVSIPLCQENIVRLCTSEKIKPKK